METIYCRRCGAELEPSSDHVYKCPNGHTIYANAAPAVSLILENSQGLVVVLERAIDPGKGRYDLPGGFCDGAEPFEDAVAREIEEEIGLTADQYTKPTFVRSGIDDYDFGGETIHVLSATFHATLVDDSAILKPDDDAASAEFMVADDALADSLYFTSLQVALRQHLLA